jgi:hypothetical protein
VRENRLHGSEGGAANTRPYPYHSASLLARPDRTYPIDFYCPMLGGSKPSPLGDGFSSYSGKPVRLSGSQSLSISIAIPMPTPTSKGVARDRFAMEGE